MCLFLWSTTDDMSDCYFYSSIKFKAKVEIVWYVEKASSSVTDL